MNSRSLGARTGLALAAVTASVLFSTTAWADGPGYTYLGASYEWTDVKYAVNPTDDANYNFGSLEGANLDASLGILSWLHINGQYFKGDCKKCQGSTVSGGNVAAASGDSDMTGYKAGLGVNLNFDMIGLNDRTDLVIRGNYLDVDLDSQTNSSVTDSGWSAEGLIRSQISERAEVLVGFEYQDLGSVSNRDVKVGLAYRLWGGIALTTNAVIFDSNTGFDLGVRWYFGDLIFGDRDSIVR